MSRILIPVSENELNDLVFNILPMNIQETEQARKDVEKEMQEKGIENDQLLNMLADTINSRKEMLTRLEELI